MRGVIFVLAAVIATAGAIAAYDRFSPAGQRAASQGAAPQSGDPLAELAGRLLLPSYYGQQDNAKYELQLFPAALPPDPKIDLPQPAGARLVGSSLRLRNGTPAALDAVLDVPASTADVAGLFERELTKLGWTLAPSRGPSNQGGFMPAITGSSRMFCKGENPPWYSISVFTPPSAPIDVRAHIDFIHPAIGTGNTYVGPCSTQNQPPMGGMYMNKLPALRPPDGVLLRGGMGSSGGNDRQTSEANATTKLSASDLETAFAQQLAGAGWTRVARSAEGPVAWSTWKLPGEGDWRGVLFINETAADRRSLTVRAEQNLN